jgi:hypothetical protein
MPPYRAHHSCNGAPSVVGRSIAASAGQVHTADIPKPCKCLAMYVNRQPCCPAVAGALSRLECRQATSPVAQAVYFQSCNISSMLKVPPGSFGILSKCTQVLLDFQNAVPCADKALNPPGFADAAYCRHVPVYYDLQGTGSHKHGWIIADCYNKAGEDGVATKFTKPCGTDPCSSGRYRTCSCQVVLVAAVMPHSPCCRHMYSLVQPLKVCYKRQAQHCAGLFVWMCRKERTAHVT